MNIRAGDLGVAHTGIKYSTTYYIDQGKGEVTPVKTGLMKIQKIEQLGYRTDITSFGEVRSYDPDEILFIKTDWVLNEQSNTLDNESASA